MKGMAEVGLLVRFASKAYSFHQLRTLRVGPGNRLVFVTGAFFFAAR
jgi:hypothetical protein